MRQGKRRGTQPHLPQQEVSEPPIPTPTDSGYWATRHRKNGATGAQKEVQAVPWASSSRTGRWSGSRAFLLRHWLPAGPACSAQQQPPLLLAAALRCVAPTRRLGPLAPLLLASGAASLSRTMMSRATDWGGWVAGWAERGVVPALLLPPSFASVAPLVESTPASPGTSRPRWCCSWRSSRRTACGTRPPAPAPDCTAPRACSRPCRSCCPPAPAGRDGTGWGGWAGGEGGATLQALSAPLPLQPCPLLPPGLPPHVLPPSLPLRTAPYTQTRTLTTLSDACCSMFFIQLRMLLKLASSVTSYTSRMPMAPR